MNEETSQELAQQLNDYLFLDSKRYNHNLGSEN